MLTNNEFEVLQSIDGSEYGENLCDEVWTFTIADNSTLSGKTISGTVSSLVKKNLVQVGGTGKEQTIGMTDEGIKAYVEACQVKGLTPKKKV